MGGGTQGPVIGLPPHHHRGHHRRLGTVTGSRGWVRICQHSTALQRGWEGGSSHGSSGPDATKPFTPPHEHKMAPERLRQTAQGGGRGCVFLKTHTPERERERKREREGMQQLPGPGQMGRVVRPVGRGGGGKNINLQSHKNKKAQAFAASSKSDYNPDPYGRNLLKHPPPPPPPLPHPCRASS